MSIPITHFYMIRHGETEANAAEIMAGNMDTPLTQKGIEQAHAAKKVAASLPVKPSYIVHSQLSRARDTAHIINEALNLPIEENSDWAEIHAGDWEGESYEITRPLFTSWITAPNGETPEDFFTRVKRAKIKALSQKNGPVLVVCHGGVMRAVGQIHDINTPGRFRNAHLYEFVPSKAGNKFPWDVFHYDLCEKSGELIRGESVLYSDLTEPTED